MIILNPKEEFLVKLFLFAARRIQGSLTCTIRNAADPERDAKQEEFEDSLATVNEWLQFVKDNSAR